MADKDGNILPTMEDIDRWRFHVEVLSKELDQVRRENERLRDLAIRSLDQSIKVLDRLLQIDGCQGDAK